MSKIAILPLFLRNKIAAGEVVERPASVVKELLENSIDAESLNIEVKIIGAGKKLIKVSDDGCGMDKEDALLAFERYATSKITNEDDLFNIKTLGFRGEALSSISAVSKISLSTALNRPSGVSEQPTLGTYIEAVGGKIIEVRECSTFGTSIEVRDLFFNTPARRKFLKSDSTENYHIIDIVTKEAIAYYDVAFSLTIDNQNILDLPRASSQKERLLQIFGKDFIDELFEVEAEYEQIYMKAFISRCTRFRGNKSNQFIFINKRSVRDQGISHAVYKSYGELIPHDKHPIFFLFVDINPQQVDFNVHPTKKEVRFRDKNLLFNFINQNLTSSIRDSSAHAECIIRISDNQSPLAKFSNAENNLPYHLYQKISEQEPLYSLDFIQDIPYIYLGETFVAIPDKDGLSIIDYHAAHERIIYERLLKKQDISSTRLLFPQNIRLEAAAYRIIIDNINLLNEFGFEIEDFGHGTLIIRCLPSFLENADLNSLLDDLASSLNQKKETDEQVMLDGIDSIRKNLAAKIACHNSIRGKDIPDGKKIAGLLKDLSFTDFPDRCPHGRPTKINIALNELKKMFKK